MQSLVLTYKEFCDCIDTIYINLLNLKCLLLRNMEPLMKQAKRSFATKCLALFCLNSSHVDK